MTMTMHEALSHSREDVGMLFHVATIKEASPRPKGGCFFVLLLIFLSLSFFVGAFSFLLIGDYHNKEILWLSDSDNNNMRGQEMKEDTSISIAESSSANETSTSLSDEQIIVKMEDLLKRMAQKNTQLNEKLHKREEEIDSLKNYLSYYDPMDICKYPECRQRDPRGSIWLGRHRGLALLLRKYSIDTTNNSMQQYNNLAYVMMPKAGSTTMKSKLNSEGWTETVWLSPTTTGRKSTWDPLIFTMIRDPGERVASAYSTIMARGRNYARNTYLSLPKTPKNTTAVSTWEEHFQKSIWKMMTSVKKNGWNNTKFHWNEHIIPQVEFMRGLNVSHIGCIDSINETLAKLHLLGDDDDGAGNQEEVVVRMNQYERNNKMPLVKFGSYDMLSDETKALIREVYEEDYALFDSLCTNNNSG